MSKKQVIDIVTKLLQPIVGILQLELIEVAYVKEGQNWFLRIFIDKPEGILIEDCQNVSERLSKELDDKDPIPNQYYLEVSSPGIDRPFKTDRDFEKNLGNNVEIKLYKPLNNEKLLKGALKEFDSNKICVVLDNNEVLKINRDEIAKISRAIEF